jgi:oxygen-independent coproporphyrinogen III oxidase
LNEYIMTSLRTMEGLSLKKVTDEFGEPATEKLLEAAQPYIKRNHLKQNSYYLQTTSEGKLLADGIAADLFQL